MGAHGISEALSSRTRSVLCVLKESNLAPLSYQESVLADELSTLENTLIIYHKRILDARAFAVYNPP